MAESNNRVQITLAIIGLVGALGTAIIANWDKISSSSKKDPAPSSSQPATPSNPAADPHVKKPGSSGSPAPAKPVTPREARTFSIDGRLTDQATGRVLCTGRVSARVGSVHQVQRADAEGRYAFEFKGFDPEDELILDADAPGHQDVHFTWKLSQLRHPQDLVFERAKPSGAALGAVIGGLAGGGKGAAIGAAAGAGAPACADANGRPLPVYSARPDNSPLTKQ